MTPLAALNDPGTLLAILSGLGLLGGIGLGIKALVERRALNATAKSKAGSDDASAASIVAAAARELIDPLRQELRTERAENAADVERERAKVRQLQAELDRATSDVSALRASLRQALAEVDEAQAQIVHKEIIILQLEEEIVRKEQEIARYKEARHLNEELDSGDSPA